VPEPFEMVREGLFEADYNDLDPLVENQEGSAIAMCKNERRKTRSTGSARRSSSQEAGNAAPSNELKVSDEAIAGTANIAIA
jgi:hypothetical protein